MVQPIFLNTPAPRETIPGLTALISGIIQGQDRRSQNNQLQNTLAQLSSLQGQPQSAPTITAPFTSVPSPAITPQPQQDFGPQLPDQRAQQVQRVVPGVSRIDQRDAIRKQAFALAMKAPASKQEALMKVIDRQFPKIEPQMLKVTDAAGREFSLPENDPRILRGEVSVGGRSAAEEVAIAKAKQKPAADKFTILKYTDKNGKPSSRRVKGSNFNAVVASIEAQGGTIQPSVPTDPKDAIKIIKYTDNKGVSQAVQTTARDFNDTEQRIIDAGGQIGTASKGIRVTTDSEGNTVFETGVGNNSLQKKTLGNVEDKILSAQASLGRLNRLSSEFDKSFVNIPGRLKATSLKVKDMLNLDLTPEETKWFDKFNTFQSDAYENINLYIKEITGAQMSELEANRLRRTLPDPENMSPQTFMSKLKAVLRRAKEATARYNWVKRHGRILKDRNGNAKEFLDSKGKSVELNDIVDIRGAEIQKNIEIANPQLNKSEIKSLVAKQLLKEF